ncbi:hypothetical protein Plhal710r2_c002g0006061 [Plasmopara halstedii]
MRQGVVWVNFTCQCTKCALVLVCVCRRLVCLVLSKTHELHHSNIKKRPPV